MSGYTGNPDAEAAHAMILSENGIDDARKELNGPVYEHCEDCGDDIDARRVAYMVSKGIRCTRCIVCQEAYDKKPKKRTKMLDWVL